jgi:transcriptional regulator with XRE-family HTH domain
MNSKVDPKIVGKRLSDARKARGITQDEAAKHLGCSRPTLIAIEQGKREAKAQQQQAAEDKKGCESSLTLHCGPTLPDESA